MSNLSSVAVEVKIFVLKPVELRLQTARVAQGGDSQNGVDFFL